MSAEPGSVAGMSARARRGEVAGLSEEAVLQRLRAEGLASSGWRNGPGERYGWHEHAYDKLLYCTEGGIVFHTDDGDLALDAGDGMVMTAGTSHAATVGPTGCRCIEAPLRPGPQE